jgi:hypothetical protein
MYKVFVNDKPLFLTNEIVKETDFKLFLLESIDIEQLIVKMFNNKIKKCYLYYPDEKVIFKKLKEKIPVRKPEADSFTIKTERCFSFSATANGICPKAARRKARR